MSSLIAKQSATLTGSITIAHKPAITYNIECIVKADSFKLTVSWQETDLLCNRYLFIAFYSNSGQHIIDLRCGVSVSQLTRRRSRAIGAKICERHFDWFCDNYVVFISVRAIFNSAVSSVVTDIF